MAQFDNQRSVDVDRRADLHHTIQRSDVLVPQPYAAVAGRTANTGRIVGAVDAVTVAHVEPVSAQHAFVLALVRAVRRDDDVAASNDLAPLDRGADRLLA